MVNFMILLSVLLVFMEYDIILRIGRVFNREAPVAYSEHILGLALARIFALIKSYRGFTLKVEDKLAGPWPERFILVANHQSVADIPVVAHILLSMGKRIRFVAKKELGAGVPLVSQALRMQGHGLVTRRGDPGQALRALDRFARNCRKTKACPVIFPEGTRCRDGQLGQFHTGALKRILSQESLPLVVVALEGGWRIRGIKEIMANLKGSGYRLRILGVIEAPLGRQAMMSAAKQSHDMIEATLNEWRA